MAPKGWAWSPSGTSKRQRDCKDVTSPEPDTGGLRTLAFLHETLTRPAYDVPLPVPVLGDSASRREAAA